MGPQFTFIQQWMNLIGLLKYGIFFSALLLFLPLSGIEGVRGHNVTGSMFLDLSAWGIFGASIFLMAAVWSVMFTEGLIVDDLETRWNPGSAQRISKRIRGGQKPTDYPHYIPVWAEGFFSVPVTWPQFVAFSFLAVPGLLIILLYADKGTIWIYRITAVVLGISVAYLGMVFLCAPARLADKSHQPLPGKMPLAESIWSRLSIFEPLAKSARKIISWILRKLSIFPYLLDEGQLILEHFFALTNFVGLSISLLIVALLFYPGSSLPEFPALVYLYILITLLIWAFAALHFHLARLHISPVLVLLVIMVVGYRYDDTDHYYQVSTQPRQDEHEQLTPIVVAKTAADNLVVLTATGGGIQAAGWTTLAL